jgi:hypothetical protein
MTMMTTLDDAMQEPEQPIYGVAGCYGDDEGSAMKTYETVNESEMAALMENLPDRPQDVGCWHGFKRSQHKWVRLSITGHALCLPPQTPGKPP